MKTEGKNESNELWTIPKDLLGYVKTGTQSFKGTKPAGQFKRLVAGIHRRLADSLLRLFTLHALDKALERKIGKPPKRSEAVRAKAEGFNLGYKAAKGKL